MLCLVWKSTNPVAEPQRLYKMAWILFRTMLVSDRVIMAKKKRTQKLSLGDFRLMGTLWEHGPLTLAEAYQSQPGQLAYTTIQTQLNRLAMKRLVARSKTRPMKYRALVDAEAAGTGLLELLIESVGGGSVIPLIAQLLSRSTLSKEDARMLKKLIDEACPKPTKSSRTAVKRANKRS